MANEIREFVTLLALLTCLVWSTQGGVCDIDGNKRIDCGWHGINKSYCEVNNRCCWVPSHSHGNIPWCFYNQNVSATLKSIKICEHHPPVLLTCASTEFIKILNVFYGRDKSDNHCHKDSPMECFNPNAKRIVENVCKCNSVCSVRPFGVIWNFDTACDILNAQLRIFYTCVKRDSSYCGLSTSPTTLHTEYVTSIYPSHASTSNSMEYTKSTISPEMTVVSSIALHSSTATFKGSSTNAELTTLTKLLLSFQSTAHSSTMYEHSESRMESEIIEVSVSNSQMGSSTTDESARETEVIRSSIATSTQMTTDQTSPSISPDTISTANSQFFSLETDSIDTTMSTSSENTAMLFSSDTASTEMTIYQSSSSVDKLYSTASNSQLDSLATESAANSTPSPSASMNMETIPAPSRTATSKQRATDESIDTSKIGPQTTILQSHLSSAAMPLLLTTLSSSSHTENGQMNSLNTSPLKTTLQMNSRISETKGSSSFVMVTKVSSVVPSSSAATPTGIEKNKGTAKLGQTAWILIGVGIGVLGMVIIILVYAKCHRRNQYRKIADIAVVQNKGAPMGKRHTILTDELTPVPSMYGMEDLPKRNADDTGDPTVDATFKPATRFFISSARNWVTLLGSTYSLSLQLTKNRLRLKSIGIASTTTTATWINRAPKYGQPSSG